MRVVTFEDAMSLVEHALDLHEYGHTKEAAYDFCEGYMEERAFEIEDTESEVIP